MSAHVGQQTPRRLCPVLEGLETRLLLDREGPALPGRHLPAADVQQFVPYLYPAGTPQPTPAEVARESFVAKGVGEYTIGPGRFDTQSITIHGFGKPASSNFSPPVSSGSMITQGEMWYRPAWHRGNVALISRMLYMWYRRCSATLNVSSTYSR